ncbi:hypothetical protein [Streptomyces sp. NPDC058751]|uniref:hypothetical protein n=1 Tax=Streptomyces sp. NPDC058751 TaxID=3346623 RepID=UPI0036C19F40
MAFGPLGGGSIERTAAALRSGGFTGLEEALRVLYVDRQHSIEDTASTLATGRNRLRRLLAEYGIPVRPSGQNSAAGRHARVHLNDRATAERVGAPDIRTGLRERAAEGTTLRELAASTGRSIPWVAARIGTRSTQDRRAIGDRTMREAMKAASPAAEPFRVR